MIPSGNSHYEDYHNPLSVTATGLTVNDTVTAIMLRLSCRCRQFKGIIAPQVVAGVIISHPQAHGNTLSSKNLNAIVYTRIAGTAGAQRMAALLQVIERTHELRLHVRHVVRHLPAAAPLVLGTPTHQTELEGRQTVVEFLILLQAMLAKRRFACPADAFPAPSRHHHVLMLKLAKPVTTDILLYLIGHRSRSPTGHVDIHDMTRICAERRTEINDGEYDCKDACNRDRYSHLKQR